MSEDRQSVHTKVQQGVVRIGPAGWSYADWKGIVYPPGGLGNMHPLTWLAQWFDTVEVNATFYHPAQRAHSLRWLEAVAEHPQFLFLVKLWERYTHPVGTWPSRDERKQWLAGILPLFEAQRLGAILIQFPWRFRRTQENRQWLARVCDTFSDFPLAVEFRHASWDCEAVWSGLQERGVAFCNIDQPLFENSLPPTQRITAPLGYVRLHGRNQAAWFREDAGRNERYDYLYNATELQPWLTRVAAMRETAESVFVVTNNHYKGQAVVNALEIKAALCGIRHRLPLHLLSMYPHLQQYGE